jgi:hypothetical protein
LYRRYGRLEGQCPLSLVHSLWRPIAKCAAQVSSSVRSVLAVRQRYAELGRPRRRRPATPLSEECGTYATPQRRPEYQAWQRLLVPICADRPPPDLRFATVKTLVISAFPAILDYAALGEGPSRDGGFNATGSL